MTIRSSTAEDFDTLYHIGKTTPEFRVSANEVFMDADEFAFGISGDTNSVFLVAEEGGNIVGFIYFSANDLDKPVKHVYACLVYLTVLPEYRKQGTAQQLYEEAVFELKKKGVTHVYGWANIEGDGAIVKFMEKRRYS